MFNVSQAAWWRSLVLLAVNLAFFASLAHGLVSCLPFVAFLALGYVGQAVARRPASPRVFTFLVLAIIAAFVWLKRYSFVPQATFLPFPYVLAGLSYVFFRVLHVVVDRHQGDIDQPVGPVSYLNYTLNFTSLVSGPIQRYQDYRAMDEDALPLDLAIAGTAFERIAIGVFKVSIVSLVLSTAQHQAIASLTTHPALPQRVWAGAQVVALYPVYLYFNFSGYVDVVIGVARFFRIILPENFDRPFSSENFLTFWSRWHITLSEWLKTYVYNPLLIAGLRRVPSQQAAPYIGVGAFFVTFFLVGLWHGQSSEFVFFGILQGGGVAANKLYQILMQRRLGRRGYRALGANALYRAASRGLTFTWFAFTLLWFWSSWRQIDALAQELGTAGMVAAWASILVTAAIALAALEALRSHVCGVSWRGEALVRSRYLRTSWSTALVVVTVAVTGLLNLPAPDIVYRSF